MWCLRALVIVLCQGIGDTSGVCGGDTSGWCRGVSSGRPAGHRARGSCRPSGPGAAASSLSHGCGWARAAGGTPLVTTLRTRASAPRRHPGSWPDVMVFGAGAWTARAEPVRLVPQPSISSLGPRSRPSTFHLVRSRNEMDVCGTRSTYEKRDQDLDNEIDVPGTSLSPPSRPSTFHLVRRSSISFVHATRSTCEERDRRARDEIKTWATRSTPVLVGSSGRRDQTRPSWRVLVAPRRAHGAPPPSNSSVCSRKYGTTPYVRESKPRSSRPGGAEAAGGRDPCNPVPGGFAVAGCARMARVQCPVWGSPDMRRP